MTDEVPSDLASLLASGAVTLDPVTGEVRSGGQPVRLTNKEFELLQTLLAGIGPALDEDRDPFTSTVRVTMLTLRRKLGDPDTADGSDGVREPRRPSPQHGSGGAAVTPE